MLKITCYFLWVLFSIVLCWFVFFSLTGEQYTIVRLLSYVVPWLLSILFILFVIALFLKQIYLAISILLLFSFIAYPNLQFFLQPQLEIPSNQPIYKVMTYSKMGRNRNIKAVAQVIQKESPDILFIQEISISDSGLLLKILAAYYNKYHFFMDKQRGLIVSKHIIVTREKKGEKTPQITIEISGKSVRVWNVHLQKSIFDTDIQYESVEKLVKQVSSEQLPVLVAGDFNATGINYPCVLLKEYLSDAFEESGFGFGFTFPSNARRLGMITPFMRIDHIFHSKHFVSHISYVVQDSGGADHYPVVALLSFK